MTQIDNSRTEWKQRAATLAGTIAAALPEADPAWLDAVAHVPRHVFVPRYYKQDNGMWIAVDSRSDTWMNEVYRDTSLITLLSTDENGRQEVMSSSTKPALMVRMLDALSVQPGHRVLEIGTGTGYNAALLCHRLGVDAVISVDIGPDLVEQARSRLAYVGYRPRLVVTDGRAGYPAGGPYDRIVATCSVSAVPWNWHQQVVDNGKVLVDLKIGMHAGNLVLLERHEDRLQGFFLPKWAGFMMARSAHAAPTRPQQEIGSVDWTSTTRIDPDPWTALVPWLLAQIGQPPVTGFARTGPRLTTTRIISGDGAWCEIGPPDRFGDRTVREGGPRRLWSTIERAHHDWATLGEPGWSRLGITVDSTGRHELWIDHPTKRFRTFVSP